MDFWSFRTCGDYAHYLHPGTNALNCFVTFFIEADKIGHSYPRGGGEEEVVIVETVAQRFAGSGK